MKLPATVLVALVLLSAGAPASANPDGQITWAVHTTLVPTYVDPAETTIITSFMVLYALHDGVVKPMPGKPLAPSLAESWTASPDGLVYEFVLRRGVKFHNGEPVTAEDVKFSFERYRGIFARGLKDRVEQLVHDKAMVAPMYELAFVNGVGRRVEESGLGLIASYAFSAPYEELKLKTK